MLIASEIKENFDVFVSGLKKRGMQQAADLLTEVLDLDDKRKAIQGQMDDTLAEANKMAKTIGGLMKDGKKQEAEAAKSKSAELKENSKKLSGELQEVEELLKTKLYNIPNIPHESVPAGNSEDDNEVIKTVGEIPKLPENALPQWDLIKEYDIVDFDLGNKVTGAGFPFYKGAGARLVRGLVNYFLDKAAEAGYMEVQPPVLINEESGLGTGQLPDKEGQMYHIEDTNLYLIPTAEVPITNIYRDVILNEKELPIKNVGYTPCFRREAGSWGSHVRGLNRLHQFDKVEIVQISKPEDSYKTLEQMVSHVEQIVASLELPFRILRLCGGDLGFTSAITYDFEVYSAAQEKWLEVSSVSNFENFQANRLKLRYKDSNGKKQLAHTLNGSALALPRIIAALIENNQEGDEIRMPKVLHPYLGFDSIKKLPSN
jgi:seryl-tRNA synthetase